MINVSEKDGYCFFENLNCLFPFINVFVWFNQIIKGDTINDFMFRVISKNIKANIVKRNGTKLRN